MEKRGLSRREFLGGLGIGVTSAVLAACAPSAKPSAEPTAAQQPTATQAAAVPAPTQVEIRFEDESGVGPEGFPVFTDVLIPKFEAANPGIKVKFEPALGDWAQKITTQMAAGDAPDVMVAYGNDARQWMESKQLLALEDSFTKDDLSDFYPGLVQDCYIDQYLYRIPKYLSCFCLVYNKDLFDAAGLKYPDENWKWEEFLAAALNISKRDDSGKATQWGYRLQTHYIAHWVWSNGGEWMDKEVMGSKILIDQPKAFEALKFNWDLQFTHKCAPMPAELEQVGFWDTFQTGKLGFSESDTWQVTDFIKRNNFKFDYVVLPMAPGGGRVGEVSDDGYGVYVNTKHKEAAVAFLRFFASPESEKEQCTSVLGLHPARKSLIPVWTSESQGAKAGLNMRPFSQMGETARLTPYFKNNAKVWEIFGPLWESIWVTGDLTLEQGIAEIVKRVNEYLATLS